jgi:5-formyltetrahydrofolate cyclo-ligase
VSDAANLETRKAVLRERMQRDLRTITAHERTARSEKIREQILASESWQNAERVVIFSPMRSEPDIAPLSEPRNARDKLIAIIPRTLRHEHELELPFEPDYVLVPGLAFSRDGHRLGRGGGFYDRLLAGRAREATKIGVCFALQLQSEIPRAEHDIIVDAVITD